MAFVRGLGVYLPERFIEAAEIAAASGLSAATIRDELGINRKGVPGPDDHTGMMCLEAAHSALDDAGMNAHTLDLVICATGVQQDYPGMACALGIVGELGASRAYGFDIGHGSGGSILALGLADRLLRADPDLTAVLVAGAYRDCDLIDYEDPASRPLLSLAAGAGAVAISREGPGHQILGSAFLAHGRRPAHPIVPVGGTREPLSTANLDRYRLQLPAGSDFGEGLAEAAGEGLREVIATVVQRSGARLADLKFLALPHLPPRTHYGLLAALDLPPDRSIYLADYGHIGPVDALLGLNLARAEGRLRSGDLVLAAAVAAGGVCDAICLRWEEQS